MSQNDALLSFGLQSSPGQPETEKRDRDGQSEQSETASSASHPTNSDGAPIQSNQAGPSQGRERTRDGRGDGRVHWGLFPTLLDLYEGARKGRITRASAFISGSNYLSACEGIPNEDREGIKRDFVDDIEKEYGVDAEGSDPQGTIAALEAILGDGQESKERGVEGKGKRRAEESGERDEEGRGKGRKVSEEDFPWYEATQRLAEGSLSESMRKTRRFIELARSDIPAVLFSIQRAANAPDNFPASE
jgi:hypothetical protein